MDRSLAVTLLTVGFVSLSTLACGGSSEDEALEDEGSGGAESNAGGNQGSGSTGGQPSSGVGGEQLACCLAAPMCDEGDTQVASAADCPVGASCYENSVCCSTIWCARENVQCAAYPVCPEGTEEVDECPEGARCSTQSICGSTILCQELDNPPSCGGGPTCPADTKEIDECPDTGDCQSVSFCGRTLFCLAD